MSDMASVPRTKECEDKYRSLHPAVRIAELANLSGALETELAKRTEELVEVRARFNDSTLMQIAAVFQLRAETAEADNAELLAALEEIKGRVQFGVSMHMSSDVVKLCNEALKEGK